MIRISLKYLFNLKHMIVLHCQYFDVGLRLSLWL